MKVPKQKFFEENQLFLRSESLSRTFIGGGGGGAKYINVY